MTVRLASTGAIELQGACPIDEAETLHGHLLANSQAVVDWTECDVAHTAVIQVLLALRPTMQGPPRGDFLRDYIAPLLATSSG
jgi:hypothetical protein